MDESDVSKSMEYVNYFHGGFDWKTNEEDSNLLEDAKSYIKEYEDNLLRTN